MAIPAGLAPDITSRIRRLRRSLNAFPATPRRCKTAADKQKCAILTTAANELVKLVHDRMPLILDPRHYDLWIDRAVQEPAALAEALRPISANAMRAYPISTWVNDPRHDDARCLEPAA